MSRCDTPFAQQVREAFARRAHSYDGKALLQRAIAWRLAWHCHDLPLPPGPRADLGAGTGQLSRALLRHCPALGGNPPLQVDHCPELLQRNALVRDRPTAALAWDLNHGLPPRLQGAALLASGFALQWLEEPQRQLAHWCARLAPGGWLALALPTAGSFRQWRQAAARAGVPCTALALPGAAELGTTARAAGLQLRYLQLLHFTRRGAGGIEMLRQLRGLGAGTSHHPPLGAGQLRRLLAHWPADTPLTWEVLVMIGHRA